MRIVSTSNSMNHIPFLSEEMERTLRRLAWKDKDFREALVADPKGIIQQMFPHCFPDGKLPDDLTIKVVEQDPYTYYIVMPSLPDQYPTIKVLEEEQVELIANMGFELRPCELTTNVVSNQKICSVKNLCDFYAKQDGRSDNDIPNSPESQSTKVRDFMKRYYSQGGDRNNPDVLPEPKGKQERDFS